jgi:uncharacterized membrane protein
MRRAAKRAGAALIVVACAVYQYLVYSSVSGAQAGPLHLILMWLPLAALAFWVVLRSRSKLPWLAALAAAGALVYLLEQRERMGLAASAGISHAAAYLFLLWVFGGTLAQGREPMIARFARRVHGHLDPLTEKLTRELTVAWCVFFAAQLVVSALLYLFAPIGVWSLFVNLLNLPLVALMFVAQAAYRNLRYPDCPRASILQAVGSFAKDASLSKSAEAR